MGTSASFERTASRKYRLLHLSDLHYPGPLHPQNVDDKAKVLKPDDGSSYAFQEQFLEYLRTRPDRAFEKAAVIVTGDLTTAGDGRGLKQASRFLFDVAKALQIEPGDVVISPGNHDMVRSTDLDVQWNNFTSCTEKFCTPFNEPCSSVKFDSDVLIVPLCSPVVRPRRSSRIRGLFRCSRSFEDMAMVAPEHLSRLSSAADESKAVVRIAAMHHHLLPMWGIEAKAFDPVMNAGELVRTLQEKGFAFVLHGHKHAHGVKLVNDLEALGSAPTCVLGGRSFGLHGAFGELYIELGNKQQIEYRKYQIGNGIAEPLGEAIQLAEHFKFEARRPSVFDISVSLHTSADEEESSGA